MKPKAKKFSQTQPRLPDARAHLIPCRCLSWLLGLLPVETDDCRTAQKLLQFSTTKGIIDEIRITDQICVASAAVTLKSGKFSSRAAPSSRPFSFWPVLAASVRETACGNATGILMNPIQKQWLGLGAR